MSLRLGIGRIRLGLLPVSGFLPYNGLTIVLVSRNVPDSGPWTRLGVVNLDLVCNGNCQKWMFIYVIDCNFLT